LKPRILLVDDEPDILDTMSMALRELLGIAVDVDVASTGEEAQRLLEASPRYDMVISDERMPGLRGVELLEWLKLTAPRTVRVLMTAYREPAVGQEAVNRAAAHLLLYKPFVFDEVVPQLRGALEEKGRRDQQERSLERALRAFRRLSRGQGV
jgi:two-component system response regulator LytT